MIWIASSELLLIQRVAEAIVADIASPTGLQIGSAYVALAPGLFGNTGLSISGKPVPVTDLSAVTGGAGSFGISLTVGLDRVCAASLTATVIAVGGALCQELVHQKQRGRDPISYDMAVAVQTEWFANLPLQPSPQDWLTGYYGTVFEFEAHAEQLAYEQWLADTMAGVAPRKSATMASIAQSEPMRRLNLRLAPSGTASPLVAKWLTLFEMKMSQALASW